MSGQGIRDQAIYVAVTGTAVNSPCMWRGMKVMSGPTAGDIILRDGGALGTILYQERSPGASGVVSGSNFSGEGIKFATNLHVTLPAGTTATIFYDLGTP